MARTFNLNVIAERIVAGFAGGDTAKKMEDAIQLKDPLTPYTIGSNNSVLLQAPVLAQLLNTLLRGAYKRIAYAYAQQKPLAEVIEGMSDHERKLRDRAVADGRLGTTTLLDQSDDDSVDETVENGTEHESAEQMFEQCSPQQENLSADIYKPDLETAVYEAALLEHIRQQLAYHFKGREYLYLAEGIETTELVAGKMVTTTFFPCVRDIGTWVSETKAFILDAMERNGDKKVGALLKGLFEMGAAFTLPRWEGTAAQGVEEFRIHWTQVGPAMAEIAGEKATAQLFSCVERGDERMTKSAIKKWELMLCSSQGMSYVNELVMSDYWTDARASQHERNMSRCNSRVQQKNLRLRRDARMELMESQCITSAEAEAILVAADKATALAKATADAEAKAEKDKAAAVPSLTPPAIQAAVAEATEPKQRTVSPKKKAAALAETTVLKAKATSKGARKGKAKHSARELEELAALIATQEQDAATKDSIQQGSNGFVEAGFQVEAE